MKTEKLRCQNSVEKTRKKLKIGVDKCCIVCYYMQALRRELKQRKHNLRKSQKTLKKVLDKFEKMC